MRKKSFFIACLLYCLYSSAQTTQTITIEPGSNASEVLRSHMYKYPSFTPGFVYFKNGKAGRSNMNLSYLNSEMLFINSKGDTLALSNEPEINVIVIDKDSFYFAEGKPVLLLKNYGTMRLGGQINFSEEEKKLVGAYGETVTGAAAAMSSMSVAHVWLDLLKNEKMVFKKQTIFYLGDASNEFHKASKETFLNIVEPKSKSTMKKYLQENRIDFNKREDIEQVINWMLNR